MEGWGRRDIHIINKVLVFLEREVRKRKTALENYQVMFCGGVRWSRSKGLAYFSFLSSVCGRFLLLGLFFCYLLFGRYS